MSRNFLIIVEGAVTEKSILKSVFEKYDLKVFNSGKIELHKNINDLFINIYDTSENDKVFLVQGPRNRIHDWLNLIKTNEEDFERFFKGINGNFAGIFIVYDVDHTSKTDLELMFQKYNDETDRGLLLLSSPCIEVLADIGRVKPLLCNHLKEYKSELNVKFNTEGMESAQNYIIKNFNELVLYYIDKNTKESGNDNVMEHPQFVLKKINELNERDDDPQNSFAVCYRYFTTVIYVCIAYINGLTKEINNAEIVRKFFLSGIYNK